MKQAIIDPRQIVQVIAGYDSYGNPIYSPIPNSARIAEVADSTFPVAEPLFWTECPDSCMADQWYFDTVKNECFPIPPSPQPVVSGAKTL